MRTDDKLRELERLRSLSHLLDSKFKGPFGFRFGLDGLFGLIPYLGDIVTTGVSLFILSQAVSIGCSKSVVLRMAFNIIVENVLDMIPILGNIIDFFWKSNNKNIALLENYLLNPRGTEVTSRAFIAAVLLAIIFFVVALGFVTFYILNTMFHWISTAV